MAGETFDYREHPPLVDLLERLRDLAGDASYKAGRDYLKKGAVQAGTVAGGTTAHALVVGSTGYRVSVTFAAEPKVTCTCPAYRRNKYCKHVVALCVALAERPADFTATESAPESPPKAPRKKAKNAAPEATASETRGAGLETVDRLLESLAADGLVGLGPDKLALFAAAGELVRARKLRRLGNLVLALQRAAELARGQELDPASFARLLSDLQLTRQVSGAHLEGRIALDAALAEDLLGKTWREGDLEAISGLELVEVAAEQADDGEFRIETGYFVDLPTGAFYAEKQIQPIRFTTQPRTHQQTRLLVDEGRLYPGFAPRRVRLSRFRRAPLLPDDVYRLLEHATREVSALQAALVERLTVPLAPREIPVLFRPAALVSQGDRVGALDHAGGFLGLDLPPAWWRDLASLIEPGAAYALFGLLDLADDGLRLRGRALVGELNGDAGPIYPDGGERR